MIKSLPLDDNNRDMQLTPDSIALAITYDATVSTETEVTLNASTSIVEVSAINTPILMKYKTVAGGTAVSTSSFDEFIGAGLTRHYKIPAGITVLAFIEQAASATLVCIEK